MSSARVRIAADYNRSLWAPVRALHIAAAILTWPLLLALLAFPLLLPLDGPIRELLRGVKLGGDLRRELEVLQQFGQGSITAIGLYLIFTLDRAKRPQLLNWLAAIVVGKLIVQSLKVFIGRPRPKFDDPGYFLGPFGAYPINAEVGVRHAWEIWADISSDLWSMPSSHTAFAAIMAVALAHLYPKLKGLAVFFIVLVASARVLFNAHYLTDVVIGGGIGYAVASTAMRDRWGQRAVETLFVRPLRRRRSIARRPA
jgi:membrane-associated phospholipid phosphatase